MTITRTACAARDAADPLAAKRDLFHLPEGMIYLDGNSLGVLPKAAVARVARTVSVEWGETLIKSWNEHGWFHLPRKIGDSIARWFTRFSRTKKLFVILRFTSSCTR